MGFRFSKRITIIPGVRLNISGKGVSTSIGPRGLSMTMGRNGTFLNAGLPGTGLSYRQRLDGSRGGSRAPAFDPADFNAVIKIKVQDDGTLLITDTDDNEIPASVVRRAKAEQAEAIQELLEKAAEKVNQELEACLSVHMNTPRPGSIPVIPPPFAIEAPERPAAPSAGLMDKLFRAGKLESERQSVEAQYQQDMLDWTAARDAHEFERVEIEKAFRLAAKGFSAQMEKALDYVISGIAWPKETLLTYQFTEDVTGVALDVDLPDESDIPRRIAEAKGNGKLSFKNRTDAQVRKDFVGLCYGSLFRVVGEVFALLPAIENCLVSGYVQRRDPATGREDEPYIISALVTREEWASLDFDRLEDIDPASMLNAGGARVSLDRSSRFKEIEPYPVSVLG
ncbi:DUF4236 domain-containing protein [Pseudomonas saponiphila]|uniref:DUF4236 domain-containing protein n=1 Tax=Pseudomonas saponiphila TaxID=556534 RepID=UPI00223FDADC|nr:DUF4236 domain-containing protein [Pseudomonas saponiphila]